QRAPARRARRNPQRHRPVDGGHADVNAEDRLRERDRHGQGQGIAGPAEQLVLADPDRHVEVPRRSSALPRLATAAQPDPLPVGDPRREAHVERAGLGDPASAPALRALLLDDRADALAFPAGLREAERALVAGDHPRAPTQRAGPRLGARLRAAALAGVAHPHRAQRPRQGGAAPRVDEVDGDLGLHIAPTDRPTRPRARPPAGEDGAEQIGEGAAEPAVARLEAGEQVVGIEPDPAGAPRAAAERPRPEERPHLVVLFALLLVGEDGVGLGDRLEPLLRLGITRVTVGVQLPGQLAIRLLDLVGGGGLGHPKLGVKVFFQPVLGTHQVHLLGSVSVSAAASRIVTSVGWLGSDAHEPAPQPRSVVSHSGSATVTMAARSNRSPMRYPRRMTSTQVDSVTSAEVTWATASCRFGSKRSPFSPKATSPNLPSSEMSCSATAPNGPTRSPCSRARSRSSRIGSSAVSTEATACSAANPRSRSTRLR